MLLFFTYISLLISLASACVQSDTKYVNFTSKVLNVEPNTAEIKHTVGGSVKILSGCSFFIRNLTIIPTGNGVYFWGVPVKNGSEPLPRVVAAALGSYNGQSATFNLDPQYSFDDFKVLEIRSEGDNRAYGAFAVNGKVEDIYSVNGGATLDFDPTKPFNAAVRISQRSFLLFALILCVAAFMFSM